MSNIISFGCFFFRHRTKATKIKVKQQTQTSFSIVFLFFILCVHILINDEFESRAAANIDFYQ